MKNEKKEMKELEFFFKKEIPLENSEKDPIFKLKTENLKLIKEINLLKKILQ